MSIDYVRYNVGDDEAHLTAQIVEIYKDVFSDDPWNEWLQCPECHRYWGVKDATEVVALGYEHCGQSLIDYWQRSQVYKDITGEVQRDQSSCWLAMDGSKVVGFCWGYAMNIPDFNSKVNLDVDYSVIGVDNNPTVIIAHQDEVGVIADYRKQNIAKQLVSLRSRDFLDMGLQYGVVRTRETPKPSVTYTWYTKIGYQILARYPVDDGRVIMGGDLSLLR